MGPWDYPGRHETLPLGQTRADRLGQVYRVDTRQPVASASLPRGSIAAVLTDRLPDFSAGPGEQLFRRRERETSAISHQMVLKRQGKIRSYQT
jgi:hypothetical protein